MSRRLWLLGGLGLGALATAGGVAWRLAAERRAAESAAAVDRDTAGFWQMHFPKPDAPPEPPPGSLLATAQFRGQPLLLNFWGTWCPPCIKEMPELDRFAREHAAAGWRVLGLAVDNPRAVRDFLARRPVAYPIAMAGFAGSELATALGNGSAGLPFTVAFDRSGRIFRTKAGETHFAELATWAAELAQRGG
jgi:thiol-disulfide isomerase/thioredoxin